MPDEMGCQQSDYVCDLLKDAGNERELWDLDARISVAHIVVLLAKKCRDFFFLLINKSTSDPWPDLAQEQVPALSPSFADSLIPNRAPPSMPLIPPTANLHTSIYIKQSVATSAPLIVHPHTRSVPVHPFMYPLNPKCVPTSINIKLLHQSHEVLGGAGQAQFLKGLSQLSKVCSHTRRGR